MDTGKGDCFCPITPAYCGYRHIGGGVDSQVPEVMCVETMEELERGMQNADVSLRQVYKLLKIYTMPAAEYYKAIKKYHPIHIGLRFSN